MTERGKLEEERSSYFLLLSAQCAHSIWVYVAMCKQCADVLTRSLAPVHLLSYAKCESLLLAGVTPSLKESSRRMT